MMVHKQSLLENSSISDVWPDLVPEEGESSLANFLAGAEKSLRRRHLYKLLNVCA